MKAVVLAAGYGTRLQPLSEKLPKPLVPVVGRPLLGHIVARLKSAGVSGIGVNAHHNAAQVIDYVERQRGLPFYISREQELMGGAGGIAGFREFVAGDDYFIVHNGDILCNVRPEQQLPGFLRDAPLVTMLLHDCPPYNNVSIDENGAVVDLRNTLRPRQPVVQRAYTGIALMRRAIFEQIPSGPSELVPLLLRLVAERPGSVRAAVVDDAVWRDVGTLEHYLGVHREILFERLPLVVPEHMPDGPVAVGTGSRVATGADLQGFVSIGRNCVVETGCALRDCVVWDDATVPQGSICRNTIIGTGWILDA